MGRDIKAAVVLHIDEDGNLDLRAFGDGSVLVLTIDERAPGDRVYEHTLREPPAALGELIGTDRIGHMGDGFLDDQTIQAIRAMHWREQGLRLSLVDKTQHDPNA